MPNPEDILSREQHRIDLLASNELDQLSDMLSSTMSYTHSNSAIDTKEDFLGTLRSGDVAYKRLDHKDVEVRFASPEVALMNGISDVTVAIDGQDVEVPLRFSIVYVLQDGQWQFESWHSVRRD